MAIKSNIMAIAAVKPQNTYFAVVNLFNSVTIAKNFKSLASSFKPISYLPGNDGVDPSGASYSAHSVNIIKGPYSQHLIFFVTYESSH